MQLSRLLQTYSVNNLGSIWYCILTSAVQIYLIVRSICRFTAYVALPWPNGQPPSHSINSYMMFVGCSIILLPFFIVVALIKIGNYSNDGRKVGLFDIRRHSKQLNECERGDDESNLKTCHYINRNWFQVIWKHSVPIGPFIHILIALCYLFPRLITEAQLIRHGFLSKADLWKTDFDSIFAHFNGKKFSFFGMLRTITTKEHQQLFEGSASLGQYFIRNTKSLSDTFYELDESGKFSLESMNLIAALLILTIRYPSVFWRVNKQLSFLFSLHLILNLFQSMIAFAAFQIAFKIFVCDPTHLLIRFRESSSLSLVQFSSFFILYTIVLHLSSISIHFYGMQKYREYRYARTKFFQVKYQSKPFYSYFCYLLAMVFFLILSFLVGPLFYEFVIIYCGSLSFPALLMISSTILYFTFWIIFWVCLALKTTWNFDYDDFESDNYLLQKMGSNDSSLLIIDNGKTYQVREDIAKQAILNFVRETIPSSASNILQENDSNLFMDRKQMNRMSLKGEKQININKSTTLNRNQNSNLRHSSRSFRKPMKNRSNDFVRDVSDDSDGEYTTFRRLRHTSSLRYKRSNLNPITIPKEMAPNDLHQDSEQEEPTYGFTYMFNPLMSDSEPTTPTFQTNTHNNGSDTSSGIHSDSNSSSSFNVEQSNSNLVKSNSLESLMQTLHRLEAAVADKPNLRSLSSIQRSVDLLNDQVPCEKPKNQHVRLASFSTENSNYGTRSNESKLVQFTENQTYSKYYNEGQCPL